MMKKIIAVALAVAVIGGLSIAGIKYSGTAEASTTASTQEGTESGFSGGPQGGEMGMPGGGQGQAPGGMGMGGNMLSEIREKIEAVEKSGHFFKGTGSVDMFCGREIPYCLSVSNMKALIDEGWTLEGEIPDKVKEYQNNKENV